MLLIWCAYSERSFTFVISVIRSEESFIVYVFFASWSNNLTYCIFLPQIETQLLGLLIHLPHISVSNVCWRLLTFLSYYRQFLVHMFKWIHDTFTLLTIHHSPITLTLSFPQCKINSIFKKNYEVTHLTSVWHTRSQRNTSKNYFIPRR
jgi:hypothetical protein